MTNFEKTIQEIEQAVKALLPEIMRLNAGKSN